MFAANRTDRVSGRITLLISSIITIKGIKGYGVPKGTKCAKKPLIFLIVEKIIYPSHSGRAKETVKVKCLEEVKI
jgi:hypothetical protein